MEGELTWLPECSNWSEALAEARTLNPLEAFATFQRLAKCRADYARVVRLERNVREFRRCHGSPDSMPVVRLALLGSSTLSHLVAGIAVGALRRGLLVDIYEGAYGQYRQELADPDSRLSAFHPDVLCLALDADHVAAAARDDLPGFIEMLRECWRGARDSFGCAVIQQTVLPRLPSLMGNSEDRFACSPLSLVRQVNRALRETSAEDGVHLLCLDEFASEEGLNLWHDASLWYSAKAEVHPRVANLYGDYLARLLAALRGRSARCLVLDLDNTLWGGVLGEDGVDGIVLGAGSSVGEAHVALQRYARGLSERGVILAVCSKNEERDVLEVFEERPEMALRRSDLACLVTNWTDKATNLRSIAERLRIGLDSLVFVDDNPAERALIRHELPMVAVPELSDDISTYVKTLARAGYFEAAELTAEDFGRARQYRADLSREGLRKSTTDLRGFLTALRMELRWSRFEQADLQRIVQLLHKTNQFNLTTRRYMEAQVLPMLRDSTVLTLQIQLSDMYGDNGIIALVIGRRTHDATLVLDTWLMSCRVLGREVEQATLNILVQEAKAFGCSSLLGEYRATAKNEVVSGLYRKLGFAPEGEDPGGSTLWRLNLDRHAPTELPIKVQRVDEQTKLTRRAAAVQTSK